MGVRRAVSLARSEATERGRAFALGPLIHNRQALRELGSLGLEILPESAREDIRAEDLRGASLVIRAHGESPQVEKSLRERGIALADATCPRVKASQLKALAFAKEGRALFLAGEGDHAEITGIVGYAEKGGAKFCAVIGNPAEAAAAARRLLESQESPALPPAIIAQTTIAPEEYDAIAKEIVRFFSELEVARTICSATKERQGALRELAEKVDALLIVGDPGSANARRLLAIAQASGKPCALAQGAADIPGEFFSFQTVGISAGASTPDFAIEEVERALARGLN